MLAAVVLAGEGGPAEAGTPPAQPGYTLTLVRESGKAKMTGLVAIPGSQSDAVAITQDGHLWKVTLDDPLIAPEVFGSVADRLTMRADEGLLGIAFEPGDASRVYVNYTTGTEYYRPYSTAPNYPVLPMPADPKRNRISRFAVVGGVMDMNSEEIIFESLRPQGWHTVNQLAFGPDGYLYAGSGDGGYIEAAFDDDGGQGVGNHLGTIIRIVPNDVGPGYTVPPDNPFADGDGPNADEVWAYGLRNPWRISFDSETGKLWAADVGQWLYEEINVIEAGQNYGWMVMEGPGCHAAPCTPPANHTPPWAAYCNAYNTAPSCEFDDECAIIGGYVYRGSLMPELAGSYVYTDFCSGRVRAVDATVPGGVQEVLVDSNLNVTSFAQTSAGELLLVDYTGDVYQLASDADGDGSADIFDNCPLVPNFDGQQDDADGDLAGNACDGPGSGNVDCSGPEFGVDSVDALKVLRHSAGLAVTQSEPCMDIGAGPLVSGWVQGDVNCSGSVTSVDALLILRSNAGLAVTIPGGCPAIKP